MGTTNKLIFPYNQDIFMKQSIYMMVLEACMALRTNWCWKKWKKWLVCTKLIIINQFIVFSASFFCFMNFSISVGMYTYTFHPKTKLIKLQKIKMYAWYEYGIYWFFFENFSKNNCKPVYMSTYILITHKTIQKTQKKNHVYLGICQYGYRIYRKW